MAMDMDGLYQRLSTDQQHAEEKISAQIDNIQEKISTKIDKVQDSVNDIRVDVGATNVAVEKLEERVKENYKQQRDTNGRIFKEVDDLKVQTATNKADLSNLRETQKNPVVKDNKDKTLWYILKIIGAVCAGIATILGAIFLGLSQL